jgi:predicted RNA-binding Zn-ribbon protein involved in translation (DUF1610 family)
MSEEVVVITKEIGGIKCIRAEGEFRVCPACGYEYGFHTSFLGMTGKSNPVKSTARVFRVILICPECGARYDLGSKISFSEDAPCFIPLPVKKTDM